MVAYSNCLPNAISVKVQFITQLRVDQAYRAYLDIINGGELAPQDNRPTFNLVVCRFYTGNLNIINRPFTGLNCVLSYTTHAAQQLYRGAMLKHTVKVFGQKPNSPPRRVTHWPFIRKPGHDKDCVRAKGFYLGKNFGL